MNDKMIGRIFGRWTVVRRDESKIKKYYICECSCDKKLKSIAYNHLIDGSSKSCGCLSKELTMIRNSELFTILDRSSVLHKGLYAKFKNETKKRFGVLPEIEYDFFIIIIHEPCFYCGNKDSNVFTYTYSGEKLNYNGIDRINSSIGYVKNNVFPCCFICNSAKSNLDVQTFYEWVKRVYKKSILKENI